jgi:DnaK suppressor protein
VKLQQSNNAAYACVPIVVSVKRGDFMENIQTEQFKHILEELLGQLARPLARREEIAIESTPDTLEQIQNAGDRALAIRRLELDSSRLRGLKDALERIGQKSYGTCQRCDGEISLKRLQAVPWTPYCLECQEAVDSETVREELIPGTIRAQ